MNIRMNIQKIFFILIIAAFSLRALCIANGNETAKCESKDPTFGYVYYCVTYDGQLSSNDATIYDELAKRYYSFYSGKCSKESPAGTFTKNAICPTTSGIYVGKCVKTYDYKVARVDQSDHTKETFYYTTDAGFNATSAAANCSTRGGTFSP